MSDASEITDNEAESRLELRAGDRLAKLPYRRNGRRRVLIHTEVPPELEGRGIGGALVSAVSDRAAQDVSAGELGDQRRGPIERDRREAIAQALLEQCRCVGAEAEPLRCRADRRPVPRRRLEQHRPGRVGHRRRVAPDDAGDARRRHPAAHHEVLSGECSIGAQEVDDVFPGVCPAHDHLGGPGVGPVHLVDHHHHCQSRLEGLAQHEPGLGQRTLGGIHQQQDTVHHRQRSFHFPAKIGVTGGVDDGDLRLPVLNGGVLCQDRDPLLPLEVTRVEDPVGNLHVGPEGAGLPQHGID